MSFRPPPPKAQPQKPRISKEKEPVEGNALWRIPEWFPHLSSDVLTKLHTYHTELLRFNLKVNLIARSTERESDEVHFADCVLACELLMKHSIPERVFDLGSGNGLPGLVLEILDPGREVLLVESDARKCEFLKHIIHVLDLKSCKVMNVRLETLKTSGIEVAVSRGLASISKAALNCNRIFPLNGVYYHLKGPAWASEVAELPSQVISVWKPGWVGEYSLPVSQFRRAIVSIQKIK